ncbi:CTP synthase-like [Lasioglossum baleicum]|uniref:CTP synthase-like n=1 Tax=Lasioglossum baleicum TaxID=434251 RepID=UPI003FCDB7E1
MEGSSSRLKAGRRLFVTRLAPYTKKEDLQKTLMISIIFSGVIVPGGFGKRGMLGKMQACKWCRTNDKPFLGICLGLQVAVVEFARNVLGMETANSTEIDPNTDYPLVIDMPEHNPGQMGGTMRVLQTRFTDHNSVIKQLYGDKEYIEERHRHRYEINPKYIDILQGDGLHFVGHDVDNVRMEIAELEGHNYYVATQFHPEYLSRPLRPSPPFLGFILASIGRLKYYLSKGCSRRSPNQISDTESGQTRYICHVCHCLFEYPNPLKVHLALNCSRLDISHLWSVLA